MKGWRPISPPRKYRSRVAADFMARSELLTSP